MCEAAPFSSINGWKIRKRERCQKDRRCGSAAIVTPEISDPSPGVDGRVDIQVRDLDRTVIGKLEAPRSHFRRNIGNRCSKTPEPSPNRPQPANDGYPRSNVTCCGCRASAASASSRFRRSTRSGSIGGKRSGKTLGSDCWAIPASSGPAATKRTGPGLHSSSRRHRCSAVWLSGVRMAPKHHPTPLSEGDRKALNKELGKARAMTTILSTQSENARAKGEALIRTADPLLCESWNERMWADGKPIDPSPTRRILQSTFSSGISTVGASRSRPHRAAACTCRSTDHDSHL
jgi:hypothetical protein